MKCELCGKPLKVLHTFGLQVIETCPCKIEKLAREEQAEIKAGTENLYKTYLRVAEVSPRNRLVQLDKLTPRDGQAEVIELAKQLADNVWTANTGLYLIGGVGCGKTMISAGIVNRALKNQAESASDERKRKFAYIDESMDCTLNPVARLISTVELLGKIQSTFGSYDTQETIDKYKKVRLLVLDDIGAEKASEWVEARFYEIIDYRYNHLLPTVITSNLTPSELSKKVGERIADRIREMCKVVAIKTSSQRITAK